ncbi:hypothetical protein GCM10020220_053920 [Nonomuraea rubra]|uniref:2OG-Fe(II) oxygenase family protein n=1 Tax=Nonomuraea rubra TaxID=46180 RepID=UPI0031E5D9E7
MPLHGPNLFPAQVPELRDAVLEYLRAMTGVGQAVMGVHRAEPGAGGGLLPHGLHGRPHHPFPDISLSARAGRRPRHLGRRRAHRLRLLTLLLQDGNGGLQVRTATGWIEAPPVPGTFVCNIGDMLDKLTGGQYRSTPHRVRNRSGNERLSFPFFFDPGWDSEVPPLPYAPGRRWDGQVDFTGTYGEYLLSKVSKVFPHLFEQQRL